MPVSASPIGQRPSAGNSRSAHRGRQIPIRLMSIPIWRSGRSLPGVAVTLRKSCWLQPGRDIALGSLIANLPLQSMACRIGGSAWGGTLVNDAHKREGGRDRRVIDQVHLGQSRRGEPVEFAAAHRPGPGLRALRRTRPASPANPATSPAAGAAQAGPRAPTPGHRPHRRRSPRTRESRHGRCRLA